MPWDSVGRVVLLPVEFERQALICVQESFHCLVHLQS